MSIQVGQTATARINPTAAGQPAPVTDVVFGATPADTYSIVQSADGMSAIYTALLVSTGNMATVKATNAAGTVLTDQAALPDVVAAVPIADALNLTITTP